MAIDFKITSHSLMPNVHIVEILVNGEVAGVIYPIGEKGIKLVSAHIEEKELEEGFAGVVVEDDGSTNWPPIPAVLITFNPSLYSIVGNKIIKFS